MRKSRRGRRDEFGSRGPRASSLLKSALTPVLGNIQLMVSNNSIDGADPITKNLDIVSETQALARIDNPDLEGKPHRGCAVPYFYDKNTLNVEEQLKFVDVFKTTDDRKIQRSFNNYFEPDPTRYEAHRKMHYVFSNNEKYCLAVCGLPYEMKKSALPQINSALDGDGDSLESAAGAKGNNEGYDSGNELRFHSCTVFINKNHDSLEVRKPDWVPLDYEDLLVKADLDDVAKWAPHADLSMKSQRKIMEKETADERRNAAYKLGPVDIVTSLFKGKISELYQILESLVESKVEENFGAYYTSPDVQGCQDRAKAKGWITPPDNEYQWVEPGMPLVDVNRSVTAATMNTLREIREKLSHFSVNLQIPASQRAEDTGSKRKRFGVDFVNPDLERQLKNVILSASDPMQIEVIRALNWAATGERTHTYASSIVFEGPPGTGKTLAASIMADEMDVPFAAVTKGAIESSYHGESAKRIRDIFTLLRETGKLRHILYEGDSRPPSIMFIDEVDALVNKRMREGPGNQMLTTFLTQLDGISGKDAKFKDPMFICCTNNLKDFDRAMASRMQKTITFGLGDKEANAGMLHVYDKLIDDDTCLKIGQKAEDSKLSGRDLNNVFKRALARKASVIIKALGGYQNPKLQESGFEWRKELFHIAKNMELEQNGDVGSGEVRDIPSSSIDQFWGKEEFAKDPRRCAQDKIDVRNPYRLDGWIYDKVMEEYVDENRSKDKTPQDGKDKPNIDIEQVKKDCESLAQQYGHSKADAEEVLGGLV